MTDLIAWSGFAGSLLLVIVGLLNFTVFIKQLRIAREQITTSLKQLELAQKQPELQLIQRAITESTDHVRLLVEKPYLRPYFYDGKIWQSDDNVSIDELQAMSELILNNFASALMHSAAFTQYPLQGLDRIIMFHLRHSPALIEFLFEHFDRFPLTGLTLLCYKNTDDQAVEADLVKLIAMPGLDKAEQKRRKELLEIFKDTSTENVVEFTKFTMGFSSGVSIKPPTIQ